jgi:hypothetical protein
MKCELWANALACRTVARNKPETREREMRIIPPQAPSGRKYIEIQLLTCKIPVVDALQVSSKEPRKANDFYVPRDAFVIPK